MKSRTTIRSLLSGAPLLTRAEFLRALGAGAAGVAALASGAGGVALAAHPQAPAPAAVDVYPTGLYPVDVLEVTAAVNGGSGPSGRTYAGGGIVRLKATDVIGAPQFFNFGGEYLFPAPSARGSVEVRKDVTILGERIMPASPAFPSFPYDPLPDADYPLDRTVVYGGKRAFVCRSDNPVPTSLVIRDVCFAYPSLAAVQVRKSSGLEVSDCVIYGVKVDATGIGFSVANGVEATGVAIVNPELFGDFRVVNNRIRRISPAVVPPTSVQVDSGVIMNLSLMSGQIVGNEIDWFPFFGIGVDRNTGNVTVAGNTITRCGYGSNPTSGGAGARGTSTPVFIERNHITGGYAGPSRTLPSKGGLLLASSNAVLRSNIVDGELLLNGILLTTFAPSATVTYRATDNRIEKNRLTELVAMGSQATVQANCDGNRFANNDYGTVAPATGTNAGMIVFSNGNQFVNEHFWGTYAGVNASPMLPCVWFEPGTSGNALSAFKYQGAPQGFDLCDQVLDQGTNAVHGYEKCA